VRLKKMARCGMTPASNVARYLATSHSTKRLTKAHFVGLRIVWHN
jgi:hypothetical protein